jgi:hypothetical protein
MSCRCNLAALRALGSFVIAKYTVSIKAPQKQNSKRFISCFTWA